MPRLVNTFSSQDANLQKQDIASVISRIDPEDTPLWSSMKKGRCSSLHPEWTQDSLRPVRDNAHLEGDEWTWNALTPAKKVGNYTQIFRESGRITESQQATSNVGNVEKLRYQLLKVGVELRKDIEYAMLKSRGSRKESGDEPRRMGTIGSWLTTNTDRGTGGADGGYNDATGFTQEPTHASVTNRRDLTIDMMDNILHSAYTNGANIRTMMCSPHVKEVFSRLARFQGATMPSGASGGELSVAPRMQSVNANGKNTIVNTADVYKGPHGTVTVMANRVMAADGDEAGDNVGTNAWFLDKSMIQFMWLKGRRLKQVRNPAEDRRRPWLRDAGRGHPQAPQREGPRGPRRPQDLIELDGGGTVPPPPQP